MPVRFRFFFYAAFFLHLSHMFLSFHVTRNIEIKTGGLKSRVIKTGRTDPSVAFINFLTVSLFQSCIVIVFILQIALDLYYYYFANQCW